MVIARHLVNLWEIALSAVFLFSNSAWEFTNGDVDID